MMNTLERTLIEQIGYAHGWENVRESTPERVVMYSARHSVSSYIMKTFPIVKRKDKTHTRIKQR